MEIYPDAQGKIFFLEIAVRVNCGIACLNVMVWKSGALPVCAMHATIKYCDKIIQTIYDQPFCRYSALLTPKRPRVFASFAP